MTPSPDNGQPTNLSEVYQQVSKKQKKVKSRKAEEKSTAAKNELGRRDKQEDEVTTLYPREVTPSPTGQNGALISPTTSPLLSALGSATTAQYTSEWTKSIPLVASQQQPPSNGINFGASPPSVAPSTNMFRESSHGNTPSSASPPIMSARPLSHPNPFTTFGGRFEAGLRQSPGRDRRSSMYAQAGHRSSFSNNPPLPHQPQAHFYGFHGLDLGLQNQTKDGVRPGENGYYCGFDTLSTPGHGTSKKANNVLLVGYESGFDVYKVERSKMDVIGRLEGLRGSVIGAKILPSTNRRPHLRHASPLVALVVHGPMVDKAKENLKDNEYDSLLDTENINLQPDSKPINPADIKEYQTSVEVYSLLRQEHIATLFTCPPVSISTSITSPMFRAPPPTGDLVVNASGNFTTVSSGVSGEVFVFSAYFKSYDPSEQVLEEFRCIGKLWTTVRTRALGSTSSSSSSVEAISLDGDESKQHGIPMMSSSGRWLAVVPPASATRLSINGSALLSSSNPNPPGIGHHNAPPQPNENCGVEAPESDGLAGRFAREGTQAAVRGAKWAADTGIQAFQYYFGKPQDGTSINNFPGDPMSQQMFPPTHGHASFSPTRHDSTLVSIFDLNRFIDHEHTRRKGMHEPIVTFSPPQGIGHLSFSPSGTMLMTVGKKGDVQEVWNLMRIGTKKSRRTHRSNHDGPHVRQVARFTRMTVANVVHVAWTAPHGRGVAILTENGTVHLYPMPSSAFQWPPARSIVKAPKKLVVEETAPQPNRGRAGAAVSSAFKAINGFSTSFRSNSSSDTAKSPNFGLSMATAVGARSSKAVAMNLSKSLGSAAKNFAHASDNKIHLPSTGAPPLPESVGWLTSKTGRSSLATLSAGNIDIYRVFMQPARGKQHPARMRKKRMVQFCVPDVRSGSLPPSMLTNIDPKSAQNSQTPTGLHGNWALRALKRQSNRAIQERNIHPLSFAELETSTPFLPFHTDRRVTMFHTVEDALKPSAEHPQYGGDEGSDGVALNEQNSEPAFGGALAGRRVFAAHPSHHLGDGDDLDDLYQSPDMQAENRLVKKGGDYEEVQIIVTTRRRRKAGTGEDGDAGEEGFFEDDCEVLDFAEDRV